MNIFKDLKNFINCKNINDVISGKEIINLTHIKSDRQTLTDYRKKLETLGFLKKIGRIGIYGQYQIIKKIPTEFTSTELGKNYKLQLIKQKEVESMHPINEN